jgi:sec-independent protein translocase protein TatB
MFDIGWTELVVIGIVALIVIGPRELPATLRTIGQMMTKVRRMASEFQGQFNDALREAELDELRKEAEKLTSGAFDPLEKVKSEIESAVEGPKTETAAAETAAAPASPAPDQIEPAQPVKEVAPADAPADSSSGGRAA